MNELQTIYKDFVHHRQETFINKLVNPAYESPKLGTSKFTNIQRVFDRVSQYELLNVIYCDFLSSSPADVLFRIFLFNHFKTTAFWELCKNLSYTDIPDAVSQYTGKAKLFTHAYMVPPGKPGEPKAIAIMRRCAELQLESNQAVLNRAIRDKDINAVFRLLKSISGIGDFLASQCCFDLLWHESTAGWEHLYALGVGAIRGQKKIGFPPGAKACLDAAYDLIKDGYPYVYANGQPVPVFPADVQNTFCESDKWFRLVRPDIHTSAKAPKKIKNKYTPGKAIDYHVPGYWVGTNGLVQLDNQG